MAKSDEYAQRNTPLNAEEAQRQLTEAERWETLCSLLAGTTDKIPAIAEPLLKPDPPPQPVIITRSTVEHFPLPSVVPSVQLFPERPVTRQPLQIKPQVSAPAPAQVQPAAPIAIQPVEAKPATANPAPSRRPDSREHSIRNEKRAEINEKRSESWVGNLSQRVLSTLGHSHAENTPDNPVKPDNQAEIAYNPQGSVDYVTYTVNAPVRKKRERSR